jgi:hypothetical protein
MEISYHVQTRPGPRGPAYQHPNFYSKRASAHPFQQEQVGYRDLGYFCREDSFITARERGGRGMGVQNWWEVFFSSWLWERSRRNIQHSPLTGGLQTISESNIPSTGLAGFTTADRQTAVNTVEYFQKDTASDFFAVPAINTARSNGPPSPQRPAHLVQPHRPPRQETNMLSRTSQCNLVPGSLVAEYEYDKKNKKRILPCM